MHEGKQLVKNEETQRQKEEAKFFRDVLTAAATKAEAGKLKTSFAKSRKKWTDGMKTKCSVKYSSREEK